MKRISDRVFTFAEVMIECDSTKSRRKFINIDQEHHPEDEEYIISDLMGTEINLCHGCFLYDDRYIEVELEEF